MNGYLKTNDFGTVKIVSMGYCVKRVVKWYGKYSSSPAPFGKWYWVVKLDDDEIVAYPAED